MTPTALIAEDEPLLAQALKAELARAWPQLQILATVGDGISAVTQTLALQPDVLFFDIRMPGQSGLEAAVQLADEWPMQPGKAHQPFPASPASPASPAFPAFPALVFVTAYDQYAVQAFEAQAVDYLLKPVQRERLAKTVSKLQLALMKTAQPAIHSGASEEPSAFENTLAQLRCLLTAHSPATPSPSRSTGPTLAVIQASVGNSIRLIPVDEVLYFEAADKYLRVLTTGGEHLIRTPLKELLTQLDAQQFWQIHRGTVVRAQAIDSVSRDEAGKLHLCLRGSPDKLAVSRLYAHLFRAM